MVDVLSQAVEAAREKKSEVDWAALQGGVLALVTPAAAREKDDDGMLPLHWAAGSKAPLELVAALLEAHKAGGMLMDDDGRLPHEIASAQGVSAEVVALLEQAA